MIHTLADVVSKNGNLLINVVQRPDGSLDPEAKKVLADMAAWMKTNREAIYDTRPWITYGEGQTRVKGGAFKEDFGFTARDVRFTQKGDGTVYAILLGKPNFREIQLMSLAHGPSDTGKVRRVQVLGSKQAIDWKQSDAGLRVTLPLTPSDNIATVIKITGEKLRSFTVPAAAAAPPITADAAGNLRLTAGTAELYGAGIALETRDGVENLGFWDNANDYATWTVVIPTTGRYELSLEVAAESGDRILSVVGTRDTAPQFGATLPFPSTGSWSKFVTSSVGPVTLTEGKILITAKALDPGKWAPMNLRGLLLRRVP